MHYIVLALLPLQIIVAILLIILVLLQPRGNGLGSAFGGGDSGGFFATRRGIQQKMYAITIVLGIAFIALAVLNLYLSK